MELIRDQHQRFGKNQEQNIESLIIKQLLRCLVHGATLEVLRFQRQVLLRELSSGKRPGFDLFEDTSVNTKQH